MRLARRMTAPAGPDPLTAAVQAGLRGTGAASLSAGVARLMDAYRSGEVPATPVLASGRDVAAYAAYRMPATVAATGAAWTELRRALPGWEPSSVLDLGAGTGGASWAVAAGLGAVTLTLLEQSADAIRLGQAILAGAASASLRTARWHSWRLGQGDGQDPVPGHADLAVSAYVLGELSPPQQDRLVALAIAAAPVVLLVEPGTPAGHRRILAARDQLLAAGYAIAAPCPHQLGCPLAAAGDWCHFAARVQRSALHRQAKGADLPYEDEKFSYVAAAAPSAADPPGWPDWPAGRVVRRPQQRKNLVTLDLCAADGRAAQVLVGKSKGEVYRRARKTGWGDRWEEAAGAHR
jgi:ribosomal protein RSM22 (predicted rRNA methylase)